MTCKPNTMEREAPHSVARAQGPVWQRIGAEARELAAREPMFAGLLSTATVASSAEDLLVSVLAARLAEAGADRNLFVETLRSGANGDVLQATEADINAVVERDPACPGPLRRPRHGICSAREALRGALPRGHLTDDVSLTGGCATRRVRSRDPGSRRARAPRAGVGEGLSLHWATFAPTEASSSISS